MKAHATKPPVFFGQELKSNGVCHVLNMSRDVTVCCWMSRVHPKKVWTAKIVGTIPSSNIVIANGRTAQEALRILERKTLSVTKALVATFARAFQKLGLAPPIKHPQAKKKRTRT